MGNQDDYDKTVGRAEMLAAMDCLMHHLSDDDSRDRWDELAMPDKFDWHILEYEGHNDRRVDYMEAAEAMTDNEFACVVKTFADITRWNCFNSVFTNAFSETPEVR